ncbi:MAG: S-methyl-5-thioribose-1-phosphate isomerase [Candidatus Omnitrophica bacterium]|nr:S-methyl-5-thioribose-1-phosphate isomerase [Candidatus Omnitrophota bacterium]
MPVATIDWVKNAVRIIDQTKLPNKTVYKDIKDIKSMQRAIKRLEVRGAPAIGVAGALGVLLGIGDRDYKDHVAFKKRLDYVISYLGSSRPTAVNLFWALERMRKCAKTNARRPVSEIRKALLKEALAVLREDRIICRKMAGYGASLIKDGDAILTHCNAGGLATVDYGTALGVIFKAHEDRKRIKVFADETRPLLQGARLTAWELVREKIDVTLICDNMAASLMANGKINKVFVGADRIASNGDTANKIGTYNVAVCAHYHSIPFYVVAPVATFDISIKKGDDIPIEERSGDEVRKILGRDIAPRQVKTYNPAFDVTPHGLISAIITERGIIRPPFSAIRHIIK